MAVTISKLSPDPSRVSGNRKIRVRKVVFDSSYDAGGESIVAADVGLKRISYVLGSVIRNSEGAGDSTSALAASYDLTNSKLIVYKANGTTDFTQTSGDLSTYAGVFEFVGT